MNVKQEDHMCESACGEHLKLVYCSSVSGNECCVRRNAARGWSG